MTQVTIIPIQYRDAANWKLNDRYVLLGTFTPEQEARLRAALNEDNGLHQFIPTQIGEVHLGPFSDAWTENDHIWHEMEVDEMEVMDLDVRSNFEARDPVEDFVQRMEKAAADGWDDTVSVEDL